MARGSVHGGGGSSRSGGGSSHRGGGFHRSGGSYYRRSPRRFYWFGRTVVFTSGISSIIMLLIFILMFGAMLCIVTGSVKSQNKQIVDDYVYYGQIYEDICEKAKSNEDGYYKFTFNNIDTYELENNIWVDGENTLQVFYDDTFTYRGKTWWLVEYNFTDANNNQIFERTYSCYEIADIRSMSEFSIAYTKIDGSWWSINADFKLENNKEYLYEQQVLESNNKMFKIGLSIVLVMAGLIVLSIVAIILKSKKTAEINENTNRIPEQAPAEEKTRFCDYCGTIVDKKSTKCPNCGSKIRK